MDDKDKIILKKEWFDPPKGHGAMSEDIFDCHNSRKVLVASIG